MMIKFAAPLEFDAGLAGGMVMAEESGLAETGATGRATTKVTLQQATTTAEQHTGGRASSADITQKKGVVPIEIELGTPGAMTVLVNAQARQDSTLIGRLDCRSPAA
jgi:hypothetical protein